MWELELIEILRCLIFDLSDSPDYSDADLKRVLVTAAHIVNQEASFSQAFTVDISSQSIEPDPSAAATKNDAFLNLTSIKAACMLDIAKTRIQNANAILVKDDKNTYDFRNIAENFIKLVQVGYCKEYKKALRDYQYDHIGSYAAIIMSPFRSVSKGFGRINFVDI